MTKKSTRLLTRKHLKKTGNYLTKAYQKEQLEIEIWYAQLFFLYVNSWKPQITRHADNQFVSVSQLNTSRQGKWSSSIGNFDKEMYEFYDIKRHKLLSAMVREKKSLLFLNNWFYRKELKEKERWNILFLFLLFVVLLLFLFVFIKR